jgi:hypothetical protein
MDSRKIRVVEFAEGSPILPCACDERALAVR